MDTLAEIKRWMNFYGWTDGGSPHSVKLDAKGEKIAKHGDAVWIEDVEEATRAVERRRIVEEFERRDRLNIHR